MVLDETPEQLIKEIGHDGLEVWWPDVGGSLQYQGFHIQEIIDRFLFRGKGLVPIEINPRSAPEGYGEKWKLVPGMDEKRFWKRIKKKTGILIGINHAVAWDGELIYDPNGLIYPIVRFQMRECWRVI